MAARRRTASEWRAIVEDWQRSGRRKEDYARSLGVSPVTLGWWQWKLGGSVSERRSDHAPSGFAQVVVLDTDCEAAGRAPDLVVELGELRVRVPPGFDAGELRRLVAALCIQSPGPLGRQPIGG
jgi:transposase-like protein